VATNALKIIPDTFLAHICSNFNILTEFFSAIFYGVAEKIDHNDREYFHFTN